MGITVPGHGAEGYVDGVTGVHYVSAGYGLTGDDAKG